MPDADVDLGAILRRHGQHAPEATGHLSAEQRQALRDLGACRTPQLGGRIEQCSACGLCEYVYNSCRNRHCPKCQAGCRAAWLEREAACLLPVEYHHVVFTLPAEAAALVAGNARLIYRLLFEAASAAVQELAAQPKYLGAQVGMVAVLHTWGQTLSLHPHLHVLATGGGLSCDRRGQMDDEPVWRSCRPGFFLPVRVLGRLFRGKFLAGLSAAETQGNLRLPEGGPTWPAWLRRARSQEWVVYSQPPAAGAEVVLKYLARYVHRVAIGNSRLVRVSDEDVTFTYKDYRQAGREKELTLSRAEFVRRFLQHVLPRGFVRVRHYGLLANRSRQAKLRICRRLLLVEMWRQQADAAQRTEAAAPSRRCCVCGEGVLEVVAGLPRQFAQAPLREDSS